MPGPEKATPGGNRARRELLQRHAAILAPLQKPSGRASWTCCGKARGARLIFARPESCNRRPAFSSCGRGVTTLRRLRARHSQMATDSAMSGWPSMRSWESGVEWAAIKESAASP